MNGRSMTFVAPATSTPAISTTATTAPMSLTGRGLGSSEGGGSSVARIDNLSLRGKGIAGNEPGLLDEHDEEGGGLAGRDLVPAAHVVGGADDLSALVVEGRDDVGEPDRGLRGVDDGAAHLVVRAEDRGLRRVDLERHEGLGDLRLR